MGFNYLPHRTGTVEVDRALDFVKKSFDALNAVSILNGVLLTGVAVANTATVIAHKLGRAPLSYFILRPRANATVWESAAPDSKNLTLIASAATTVDLWVF